MFIFRVMILIWVTEKAPMLRKQILFQFSLIVHYCSSSFQPLSEMFVFHKAILLAYMLWLKLAQLGGMQD